MAVLKAIFENTEELGEAMEKSTNKNEYRKMQCIYLGDTMPELSAAEIGKITQKAHEEKAGKKAHETTIYRLMSRHKFRKIAPYQRHREGDIAENTRIFTVQYARLTAVWTVLSCRLPTVR